MISGSEEEEFKAPDEEEVEPSNERSSPKRKRGRPRSGCGGHYGSPRLHGPNPRERDKDYDRMSEEDLKCSICFELLREPIRLKCNHCLCKECVEQLLKLSSRRCPQCRRWINGARRISDWMDRELWVHIQRKYLGGLDVQDQIREDRKLALALHRREKREATLRRQRNGYSLRSSSPSFQSTSSTSSFNTTMSPASDGNNNNTTNNTSTPSSPN